MKFMKEYAPVHKNEQSKWIATPQCGDKFFIRRRKPGKYGRNIPGVGIPCETLGEESYRFSEHLTLVCISYVIGQIGQIPQCCVSFKI
jgi:hypothetical protein